jgi:hypothetical protein
MASKLDLGPAWQPRSIAKLGQLQLGLLGCEFDFAGVLLWAGEVIASELLLHYLIAFIQSRHTKRVQGKAMFASATSRALQ